MKKVNFREHRVLINKISCYIVGTKLYPPERTVGSYKATFTLIYILKVYILLVNKIIHKWPHIIYPLNSQLVDKL